MTENNTVEAELVAYLDKVRAALETTANVIAQTLKDYGARKAEISRAPQKPPHVVSVRLHRCSTKGGSSAKALCQLRRHDNNEWLWSSKPYADPGKAVRDAKQAAVRFGWVISRESRDACIRYFDLQEAESSIEEDLGSDSAHEEVVELRAALTTISGWLTQAAQGKERPSAALGEIAALVEKKLGLEQNALWPDKKVPDLSDGMLQQLGHIQRLLLLVRNGVIDPNEGVQKISRQIERVLGLTSGAIWPEGAKIPVWSEGSLRS